MITKEQYMAKIKAYADKGIVAMSYEIFASLPETSQSSYLGTLEETSKKFIAATSSLAAILPAVPEASSVNPEITAALNQSKELTGMKLQIEDLTKQITEANLHTANALQAQIDENSKKELVSRAMHQLTNVPTANGSVGSKISENVRKTVEFNLANADNKKKFPHPEKPDIQVTAFDMVLESYANQPVINMSVQKSLLANQDPNNISVTLEDFGDSTENPSQEEIKSMQIVKIAKDYAKKNNLDYMKKEDRTKAINYANSVVYATK